MGGEKGFKNTLHLFSRDARAIVFNGYNAIAGGRLVFHLKHHVWWDIILAGMPQLCPTQPIDCNTVFENNVGADVDPAVSGALNPLIDALHP